MAKFNADLYGLLSSIEDPRKGKVISYLISEVVLLVILGCIAGCDDWEDIKEWGELRLALLREHLPFANGIPTAKTMGLLMGMISTSSLNKLIIEMSREVRCDKEIEQVSLDGKHIGRGLNTVSAYNISNSITIAQSVPYTSGNELSHIKEVLSSLDLKGKVVTMDALSCQQDVLDQVKKQKGEAVISLKKNQKYLYTQAKNYFEANGEKPIFTTVCTVEKGHGRIEERVIKVLGELKYLPECKNWQTIKAIAEITSTRIIKGKSTTEKRYHVMTKQYEAEKALEIIRNHWHIENKLHWMLDVNNDEDGVKACNKRAIANIASCRRIALNAIKKIKPEKMTFRSFQRRMSRDENFMKHYISLLINQIMCVT